MASFSRELPVAGGNHHAGGQALEVPFPGAREGLVEVVDVEHQRALGRGEEPEVGQVGIAADLGPQPERGVVARSEAMMRAAPRKKVNGETSIRP